MSALPLRALTVRPIQIPVWNNQRLHADARGSLWINDNLNALRTYYDQLRPYFEGEPLVDFWNFCKDKYKDALAVALDEPPECSICRRHHGHEITHEAE